MMFPGLRNNRDIDEFQMVFKCLDNSVKACNHSEAVMMQVLSLFQALIQIRALYPVLETTNMFSILMFVLSTHKDNSRITELGLMVTSQAMTIPRMGSHFSSAQFVQTLAFIGRVNPQSKIHAIHIASIALYLNPRLDMALQDLCTVIVVMSRNFGRNEKVQELLADAYAHIAGTKILAQGAAVSVPHFTKIAQKFPQNDRIFKSLLTIVSQSPKEAVVKENVNLIVDHTRCLKEDYGAMQKAVEVLSSKVDARSVPLEALSLLTAALSMFISNVTVAKQVLTACYYSVASTDQDLPTAHRLIDTLSAVLTMHQREPSLVRRAAGILHSLSSNEANDIYLSQSGIPFSLLAAANANMKDQSTVGTVVAALSNFTADNPVIASQMDTKDQLKVLKTALTTYRKVPAILKAVLVIMKAVALSTLGFDEFLDASAEHRAEYQISSSIGASVLKSHLGNIELVKATLLLMKPNPDNAKYVAAAMLKYSTDREVQMSGLLHDITDLSAINRALQLLGESALRFALKSLKRTEEALPQPLVEFLLSLDRNDAIELLVEHIGKASGPVIASQFKLEYPEQIVIAKALAEQDMWKPSDEDSPVILTALYHSVYDENQLLSALLFTTQIGLTDASFVFLIECIKTHGSNGQIASLCADFISSFEQNDAIEKVCEESHAVAIGAYALKSNKKNEDVAYSLLKMFHYLSFYRSLASSFSGSIVIPMLVKASQLSPRCSVECCGIFKNLSEDESCVLILNNTGADKVAFTNFSVASYDLVEAMVSRGFKLSHSQFEQVSRDFAKSSIQLSAHDLSCLLHIMLSYYESEEHPVNDLDYKLITPLLKIHEKDPRIVTYCADLLHFANGCVNSEELLFALFEAVGTNSGDISTVRSCLNIIKQFSKVDKHRTSLETPFIVELLEKIMDEHISDVQVASVCLTILKNRTEAIPYAFTVLQTHKDESVVLAACHCISTATISSESEPEGSLQPIIETIKTHITSIEICQALMPVLFFASSNPQRTQVFLTNIPLILDVLVRYITVIQIVRACLGILCNLSEDPQNISMLSQAPPLIGLAMKVRLMDEQIQYVGCLCIQNFAQAKKGNAFVTAIPALDMSIRNNMNIEYACMAITQLKDSLKQTGRFIASDLFDLVHTSDQRVTVLECLNSIAQSPGVESVVTTHLPDIFELVNTCEDDDVSSLLLMLCASLRNPENARKLESSIPSLLAFMRGPRFKLATSAAQCILTLACVCPETLDVYSDNIIQISGKASGELLRICLQIREKLFGIRPRRG